MICRHLLDYLSPVAAFALFAISIWSGQTALSARQLFELALQPLGHGVHGMGLWVAMSVYLANAGMRIVIARCEGVRLASLAYGSAAACAAYSSVLLPLALSLAAAALGQKTRFVPTGTDTALARDRHWTRRLSSAASVAGLLSILVLGLYSRPAPSLNGFGVLWIGLFAAGPFAAFAFSLAARLSTEADRQKAVCA